MVYALIGCLIIIGFLGFKLYQKKTIDTQLMNEYQAQIQKVKEQLDSDQKALNQYNSQLVDVRIKVNTEQQKLTDLYNQLDSVETSLKDSRDEYHHLINNKMKEIDETIQQQRQTRQQELDAEFDTRRYDLELQLSQALREYDEQAEDAKSIMADIIKQCQDKCNEYQNKVVDAEQRFESIERALAQYEKDKQAKLFYTIQLPEEFRDDIEFLLTTVAAKVQHPDIISKLVWAEYVKPNLDNTFKRIEIKAEPGIYKLTNIDTGKCYIGKSTNVKTRIADHFKSSIGIKSIADQAVHHAILKEGFWNWSIEVITYCDKDKLSELEKYYIEFFKSQEFGYNKNSGG